VSRRLAALLCAGGMSVSLGGTSEPPAVASTSSRPALAGPHAGPLEGGHYTGPPEGGHYTAQEPNRGGAIDLTSRDLRVAQQRIRMAPGYEVNLFASEQEFPEIAKPVAIAFDARGRLWVLTSPTYPHLLPGKKPTDKIVILEDTNGDGRADTSTVFADGLYQPMGFELGDGGAYVAQQPNLAFLRDTNGDDKADEHRVILHGFGTEDSHHSIHAFQWGPGGDLYFQEGTFHHSQVETPHGPVRVNYAAVFRYVPKAEKLEVFVSYPFANPWGHVVDSWGQHFISDASGGANYYGTPFSGHVDYPRKQRPMKEWTLTKVRPTGNIEFIRSRHFPDEAQGNFLITNVIGFHGIKQYRTVEDGSGFTGIEVEPLLQSTDPNFRPVAMQMGPDGALYFGDWFNPLIGHMQYSLRDPRRDVMHGRIWRVTAKNRPLASRPTIHGEPIAVLLENLKAYEDRTRYWTRRELRERPTDEVVAALGAWVSGLDRSHKDYEHHLLEALWVYEHHDVVREDLLRQLLGAKEFRARAAAVRVLQHWSDRVANATTLMEKAANDAAPRVRLEAVRSLSFIPTPAATDAALDVLKHTTDYYIQYTLESTITTLEKAWKPALTKGQRISADHPEGLAYLLERLSPAELTALPRSEPVFHELLSRPGVETKFRSEALEGLSRAGGRSVLTELIAAIERIDGTPASAAPSKDLAALLVAELRQVSASRPGTKGSDPFVTKSLQGLAIGARNAGVREGAWAAMAVSDGGLEQAWQLASSSARHRIDLINGVAALGDAALKRALHPLVVSQLSLEAGLQPRVSPVVVAGRYIRVLLPGRERTLGLAEVEVVSGGANVAPKGTASQSSSIPGGDFGGAAAEAIDGDSDVSKAGRAASFTSRELDPWWELDLGAEHSIETLVVRPYLAEGDASKGALHIAVLDASRNVVAVADGFSTEETAHTIRLGGDLTTTMREAAMAALPAIPGHDADSVALLARFVGDGTSRAAAIAALGRIPQDRWPASVRGPLADSLVAYAKSLPTSERTGAEFKQAVAFGRAVAAAMPAADGQRIAGALDSLAVRTIRITALVAQLKFDVEHFAVAPGEEVEIVLVNPDHMPHNLLVTRPGKLEDVSLKAEAMAAQPDAFEKHFVPDTPDVLHATKLVNHNEIARLRFTAPSARGKYPYVCTFPGHWRTMNGTMEVTGTGTGTK
jgi:azurin